MIIDYLAVLSDAQAVTASAASTNVIDTLAAGLARHPGVRFQFLVDTTADSSGDAATVTFSIQDSADNSSFADIVASPARAQALLVAGYVAFEGELPYHRRYVRGYYTVGTENLTAGKFDLRLLLNTGRTMDKAI